MEDIVNNLAEPECSYPVIVTEQKKHVVWLRADSQAEALQRLQNDGAWYEKVRDDETLVHAFPEMRSPDRCDWDDVYGSAYGGSYPGLECEAHVDSHRAVQYAAKRAAEQAACRGAGHPEVTYSSIGGDPWCKTCGPIKPQQLVADVRAAATAGGAS
ncbi:hypothetical protein ABZS66_18990 [Dactylosporangium sp. NPDC005572]|uniref:hypothetical protein n=1 Tax=Dactylosporangium sp. NPDC005572 TaxID=3156889 RepID=UPI0033B139C5